MARSSDRTARVGLTTCHPPTTPPQELASAGRAWVPRAVLVSSEREGDVAQGGGAQSFVGGA